MGKILHLIPDEKITDNVIENFENVFSDNIFFVLGKNNGRKYCKTYKSNVIIRESTFFKKENIEQNINAVVVHGLNYVFARLIIELDKSVKVAWFAWGFDIYNLPKFIGTLYAPRTLLYIKSTNSKFIILNKIKRNELFRTIYYKYIRKTEDFYAMYEQAHKRINLFCTYIKEDFDSFISAYPNKLEYFEIGYFNINQYLAEQPSLRVSFNAVNILVGNSNSVENNHMDIFKGLYDIDFEGKVIVPLSYGTDYNYQSDVVNDGKEKLKEKFTPLLNFMDRDKYVNLLSDCSTAIFYHYRQQAMGNILAFLYMGGRVYLSRNNPIFHYLKRIGVVVFDFNIDFSLYKNAVLEKDQQEENREILTKVFSQEALKLQYIDLVNQLQCQLIDN